ncbi:MAG: hypothetical protein HN421_04575 [Gammaproteobacteria bacterium]|jgi:long-chain fatty acid transport protein|nr:hypothetical protein [Gammaproteobacteria bacterium]MBT3488471.1 hypothetical protein [Gammaproteobacteria bacterium]MBT3846158.1 hypothetical protein [Gammaproteobacteria bacterium]MBT6479344.1 hypothetical protein [Gammaproteobacteria bacterium]MBT7327573.1 hypothetical protein [Gammaproteobacteria bacterium]
MKWLSKALVACFFGGVVTEGYAAGFYLKEQSIVSQGQAFAGVAAQSGLASAAYFNPAGLSTIEQGTLESGFHWIEPDQKVATDTDQQSPLSTTLIPNLYWATPVSADTVIGLGVNAAFGSDNEYDAGYFGSSDHIKGSLNVIDYTAAVGHQLSEQFRLGAAFYYQTLDVEQTKASGATQTATLDGEADTLGFSLGLQYRTGGTTLGLSHRSGTEQDVVGTNTIVGAGGFSTGIYTASATMKLPAITALGVEHNVDDYTNLYLGVTRYDWSVYDSTTVTTRGIPQVDPFASITTNNYHDTTSFSFGINHQVRSDLELRGGFLFDPTPTNDTDRSYSTPDGDRTWLTMGASKIVDQSLIIDLALSHIKVDPVEVNKPAGVKARVDTTHNIISIGVRKSF